MKASRAAALLLLAALWGRSMASPAAESLGAEMGRCAAITSPEARLSCYDKLALGLANAAPTRAAPAPAPAPAPAAAPALSAAAPPREAPPVTAPGALSAAPGASAVAPSREPAPAAAPDSAAAAQNFGLSSAQAHVAPQGPQSIEAHVAQVGVDRGLRSYVVLDNGQTWLSTDGGMELNSGEQVTIKHAALGSFMLISTASKHSYHVRRIR